MNVIDRPPAEKDIESILGIGRKRKAWPKRLAWLLAVLCITGAAYFILFRQTEPEITYSTQPVMRGDLTVTVTATGTLQPTDQVDVSSELSGIVRKVLVEDNDQVEAGQVLAELDTVTLTAQVERSRASLAATQARVSQAEATVNEKTRALERTQTLTQRQFASENALDVAKAEFERAAASLKSAQADVRVAEAELKQNETSLAKAKIYSPITGVVLRRSVEPGQTVASSFQTPTLFTLANDLHRMELQVDVDEADIGEVRAGQKAAFTVEAYQGRTFPAAIETVRYASETVNGVVTYKAILSAQNQDLALRPGMTATAEIVVQQVDGALLIPNAALRWKPPEPEPENENRGFSLFRFRGRTRSGQPAEPKGNERRVFVLRNGVPQAADITIGATDGKQTAVTRGLEADALVIVDSERPGDGV